MNELNGALSSDCSNYSGIYSLTILTILANYSVSQHSWNKLSYRSVDRIVNKIYFITTGLPVTSHVCWLFVWAAAPVGTGVG